MISDDEGDDAPLSETSSNADWEHEFQGDFEDPQQPYIPDGPAIDISELASLLMGNLGLGHDAAPVTEVSTTEYEKAQAIEHATRRALDDTLFQMASENTMNFTSEESLNLVKQREEEARRAREKNLFNKMHITVLFRLYDSYGKRWPSALPNRQEIDAAFPEN
jgi:hypothetical protein